MPTDYASYLPIQLSTHLAACITSDMIYFRGVQNARARERTAARESQGRSANKRGSVKFLISKKVAG